MADSQLSITSFVRGMAWHDLGKPFALGTPKHAALSYWLLRLAGYDEEALVALAHGHSPGKYQKLKRDAASNNPKTAQDARRQLAAEPLRRYFEESAGPSLPGILVLCHPLDELAASAYSFQHKSQHHYLKFHSSQNPFSHLPSCIPGWPGRFFIPKNDLATEFEPVLWEHLLKDLPGTWQAALSKEAKRKVEGEVPALPNPDPLPAGDDALQVVRRYMAHYPERTYPSVNDTSLEQHCRLSGILAFVVYRNLERNEAGLLEQDITHDGEEIHYPEEDPERVVQKHLKASLVRVAFEGHRSQYENAVRVDDLLGARALTDRTRKAFKLALAEELDAPDLADQLTISESQFDLAYLLPGEGAEAEVHIRAAYERALGRVAADVASELERDFPQITGERIELRRQLGEIAYGVRAVPVAVPEMGSGGFGQFAAEYGRRLLDAYQDSLKYAVYPWLDVGNRVEESSSANATPTEPCQVCGNFQSLVPPEGLNDVERARWEQGRDYAAHTFRSEREQLCLSCVTRRTLAHGEIARQLDPIVHPMWEPAGAGGWRLIQPSDGPDVPPLSATFVGLTDDQIMEEAGAFFIRCRAHRHGADCSEIDIFPTTTYASDANGNVVLLALRPRPGALFACYPYDEAIAAFDPEKGEQLPSSGDLVEKWQASFVEFHKPIQKKYEQDAQQAHGSSGQSKQKILDPSEPVRNVQPHLARVMERIQQIRRFYADLYERLAEHSPRLRVLPLDTEYPTLRLLVPADRLDQVLERMEEAVTETLFSADAPQLEDAQGRQALHRLLALLVPDLLHGAVVLFKHKFPLYLALEAERDLFRQLQTSDPNQRLSDRPGNAQWYGLRLAFTDLRGTLSQVGPLRAEVTYAELGPVLDLAQKVDRRTVLLRAEADEYLSRELADALTVIRARQTGMGVGKAEALNNPHTFPSVLFLKRATRR